MTEEILNNNLPNDERPFYYERLGIAIVKVYLDELEEKSCDSATGIENNMSYQIPEGWATETVDWTNEVVSIKSIQYPQFTCHCNISGVCGNWEGEPTEAPWKCVDYLRSRYIELFKVAV